MESSIKSKMSHPESNPFDESFRSIEEEFRGRPDHKPIETIPALITMPDEIASQQATAMREAREKIQREQSEAAYRERFEREKREKRIGRLKKAFAVAAIFMTYKSGGLIDIVGDQVTNASEVAADALQVQAFEIPNKMDGKAFEDYSQDVQDEVLAEGRVRVEKDEKTRDTLVDLFSDIDANGSEGLLEEVDRYKSDNAEKFVSIETIDSAIERIDGQDTNTEIMATLDEFMSTEYGIHAGFDTDNFGVELPFDERNGVVKDIAKAYVEVFGALPKDFVELADIETVQISDQIPSGDEGAGLMGRYSPDENRIRLYVHGPAFNVLVDGLESIPYIGNINYQATLAHELGHAFDEKLILPVTGTKVEADGIDFTGFLEHAARTVIYKPELPALDAAENDKEHTADVLSGILTKKSTGLAETNEWRRFGSESNKNMIRMLAQLESASPGIAKILVANRISDH